MEATRLCGGEGKLSKLIENLKNCMNTHGRKQHMAIYGLDMDSIGHAHGMLMRRSNHFHLLASSGSVELDLPASLLLLTIDRLWC